MDILSLILSCSLTLTFDDKLIESIINVESFKNASYVRSDGSTFGVGYGNKEAAQKAILEIAASGNESYIGLMGLPYNDTKNDGYTIDRMLDQCGNIQIGTAMIDMYNAHCKAEGKIDLATCMIKKYARYTGQNVTSFTHNVMHYGLQIPSKKDKKEHEKHLLQSSVVFDLEKNNSINESVFLNIESENSNSNFDSEPGSDLIENKKE